MKLLIITPYYKDSFAQNLSMGSAVKQAEQLSKKHQVIVLTTGRSKKKEIINKNLTVKSVKGTLLPDPINYVIAPAIFSTFLEEAGRFRPDFVLVSKFMFFTSLVIPLAKFKGLKVITTTDTFPGINWFPRSSFVSKAMWLYSRLIGIPLLKMSNKVILLYKGLEPIAKKYQLNYFTISNGVDPKNFKKISKPKDLKKTKKEFWVGFVGRPESVKGIDLAHRSAVILKDDPEIKFVFVGGKTRPHKNENKIYLGFREDIEKLYQLFDCLILPSYSEGLPNVILEAMAQSVPVIASNVGAVSEIIKNNQSGIIINSPNPTKFAKAIKKIKNHPQLKTKLGSEAKKVIENKYNWSKITKEYDILLTSL